MATYRAIAQAIDYYDNNKAWYRKLFGDQADIKRLKIFFKKLTPVPADFDRDLSVREERELRFVLNGALTNTAPRRNSLARKALLGLDKRTTLPHVKHAYIRDELAEEMMYLLNRHLRNVRKYEKKSAKIINPSERKKIARIEQLLERIKFNKSYSTTIRERALLYTGKQPVKKRSTSRRHKKKLHYKITTDQFYEFLCLLAADYEYYKDPYNPYFSSDKSITLSANIQVDAKVDSIIKTLKQIDLFNPKINTDHIKLSKQLAAIILAGNDPHVVFELFKKLRDLKLLTPVIEQKIIENKKYSELIGVIQNTKSDELIKAIKNKKFAKLIGPIKNEIAELTKAIQNEKSDKMLIEAIKHKIIGLIEGIKNKKFAEMIEGIEKLYIGQMLTSDTLQAVVTHQNPSELADAFNQFGLIVKLPEKYMAAIAKCKKPMSMASAIHLLQRNFMLDRKSFSAIAKCKKPMSMASAIHLLKTNHMLDDKNFSAIKKSRTNPLRIAKRLVDQRDRKNNMFFQGDLSAKTQPPAAPPSTVQPLPAQATAPTLAPAAQPSPKLPRPVPRKIDPEENAKQNLMLLLREKNLNTAANIASVEQFKRGFPAIFAIFKSVIDIYNGSITKRKFDQIINWALWEDPDNLVRLGDEKNAAELKQLIMDKFIALGKEDEKSVATAKNPEQLAKAFMLFDFKEEELSPECRAELIKHPTPALLAEVFSEIGNDELSSNLIKAILKVPHLPNLKLGIEKLKKNKIYNKDNRDALIAHENPLQLADEFVTLHKRGLFNTKNRAALIESDKPGYVRIQIIDEYDAAELAKKAKAKSKPLSVSHLTSASAQAPQASKDKEVAPDKLKQEVLTAIEPLKDGIPNILAACRIYESFYKSKLQMTSFNRFIAWAKTQDPKELIKLAGNKKALESHVLMNTGSPMFSTEQTVTSDQLQEWLTESLLPECRTAIIGHAHPNDLITAFYLVGKDNLTPDLISKIAKVDSTAQLIKGIITLKTNDMFDDANRDALLAHQRPDQLAIGFVALNNHMLMTPEKNIISMLLTPENRAALCKSPDPIALSNEIIAKFDKVERDKETLVGVVATKAKNSIVSTVMGIFSSDETKEKKESESKAKSSSPSLNPKDKI